MLAFIFWGTIAALFYIYFGYPLLVWLLGLAREKPITKNPQFRPLVTILIAAYNEEKVIGSTLANLLLSHYLQDLFEIIVVSDASTDGTDRIVEQFAEQNVRLLRQTSRAGKTAALNRAVMHAKGEILVFADANSCHAPEALAELVANFNDPEVGYVTGRMVYTDPDGSIIGDGCSAFMKYENFLRKEETRLGSIVGVDGGIDAMRKSLYRPMNDDQLPDFVLPLQVVEQGFRVIYEPKAILREAALQNTEDEYRMRVRVALRALWAIWDMRRLLNPIRFGIFAWQLWSHKLLRYASFIFMALAYLINARLVFESDLYGFFFLLQNLVYCVSLVAMVSEGFGSQIRSFYPVQYFVLLNLTAAHAFGKFLLRRKMVIWTPRKG
jgi:cellulose synthase/poly-beta-1,6-N-acetylglucosamine synthase-like glycosyltransferase